MQPAIFYTMLAVVGLLTPLALQSEVRRVFGWSIHYIRALLITGVLFGTPVMSAYIASRIVPVSDGLLSLSLELLFGLCMLLIGLVCTVAASSVLLRSPSGYPIQAGHSGQIIGALFIYACMIFFALTSSLTIGMTHSITTPVSGMVNTYGPILTIGAFIGAMVLVSYVIERFSQSELGWEPKRMGLVLVVVTAPVAVVAGFVVVKPWLPASAADITPVHTLLALAAALALSALLCWSVLSMEARRLLPILGTGRLGIFIGVAGGPFVFGQLAATSGAELSATYAKPLPLFVAYLATVGMVFWCIERFAYHQLRGEVTGYGTALVLFGTPIVVIAALPLLKPLLPTTLEAVRPLHAVVGMLTINLLFSSIVWPLLSFDARESFDARFAAPFRRPFNRPPRVRPGWAEAAVDLPEQPYPPRRNPQNIWLLLGIPLLTVMVMMFAFSATGIGSNAWFFSPSSPRPNERRVASSIPTRPFCCGSPACPGPMTPRAAPLGTPAVR